MVLYAILIQADACLVVLSLIEVQTEAHAPSLAAGVTEYLSTDWMSAT
ncbi:MAG: hypothetical protein A4E23_01050 [Methanomethylovorans sp. PtaU1.Bin073]|nr:MAG: hypothetical protein A4E23_01050 [Methanomethylovorans sp. PtaU1.Bin073]